MFSMHEACRKKVGSTRPEFVKTHDGLSVSDSPILRPGPDYVPATMVTLASVETVLIAPGNPWLPATLVEAAWAATHAKHTYLQPWGPLPGGLFRS
jgi:hypothetical protein